MTPQAIKTKADMKWEIQETEYDFMARELAKAGWEPYAVNDGVYYFRRPIKEMKDE